MCGILRDGDGVGGSEFSTLINFQAWLVDQSRLKAFLVDEYLVVVYR